MMIIAWACAVLHARMHTFELKLLCMYKYPNDWIQRNDRSVKNSHVDESPKYLYGPHWFLTNIMYMSRWSTPTDGSNMWTYKLDSLYIRTRRTSLYYTDTQFMSRW